MTPDGNCSLRGSRLPLKIQISGNFVPSIIQIIELVKQKEKKL
jgi:hypothetical protein